MEYRPLGKTGLTVSAIGIGTEHLDGRPYEKVEEVIQRLDGIRCGNKSTSCPDQLAKALKALPKE